MSRHAGDGPPGGFMRPGNGVGTMAEILGSAEAVARLIAEARRGSREALGGAIESLRADLVLVAHRELGRDLRAKADASDVVQEALFKAQRDFAGFRGMTEEQFRAWLLTILRHCLLEVRRRYRSRGRDAAKEEPAGDFPLPS